ncbi:MAG: hypothetical protein OXH15_00475 [Gammaproteobacteria bacterium]|nr:hypothetical protein [Gammaproteobacteria bacterium]
MSVRRWIVPVAAAALAVAALLVLPPRWIVAIDAVLQPWRPWLGALRVSGIVAAWIWWDRVVAALPLPADAAAHLRSRRHFWCGALAAVELVLVRNVFGVLWRLAA